MEIASPVVVNEKGDSRVSRKWERLALRGSIVVLFGFVLVGAVRKGAVGVCAVRLSHTSGRFGCVQLVDLAAQEPRLLAPKRVRAMAQHVDA